MSSVGAWFVGLTAYAALTDVISRWYYSRDVDYDEGCEWPDRWLCWGTCLARGSREYDMRYFLLRLPSYDWLPAYRQRLELCQRCIHMFNGRWSIGWARA